MDPLDISTPRCLRLRDAGPDELDQVAAMLGEVYGAFREYFPADGWQSYIREIIDVRGRVGESELIVAEGRWPPGRHDRVLSRRLPLGA